jgi:hypothetical protein
MDGLSTNLTASEAMSAIGDLINDPKNLLALMTKEQKDRLRVALEEVEGKESNGKDN